MLINRITCGLDDEHIHTAHVLQQLEVDFAIGKALHLGFTYRYADVTSNLFGQRPVGRAAEELEPFVLAQVAAPLALGSQFGILCFACNIRGR